MKKVLFSTFLTLITVSTLFLSNALAQNTSTWGLPEGVKARLGKGLVRGIDYSPDGARLAVASSIGIWLYDAETYQTLSLLTQHTSEVYCVAFSPDGKTIASGSSDRTIRLWDAASGQQKKTLIVDANEVSSVAFSPDGKTLASFGGWSGFTIRLWDASTGQHKQTLTGHTQSVRGIAFSPDGKTIASGSYDNTIRLWNVAIGQQKKTLTEHTGVDSIAFSPDGKTIASGGFRTINFWDVGTGQHKQRIIGHTCPVFSVAFSPDGTTLASGGSSDRTIQLWDAATGTHKYTLTEHIEYGPSVAFSPDGKTLASGGYSSINFWDVGTGEHKKTLQGHSGPIKEVSFSPDGMTLVSGSLDNAIRLWEVVTGQQKKTIFDGPDVHSVVSVAFSPDGKTLASGSGSGDSNIRLWDVATGQHKQTLTAHTETVSSIAFSPDGKTIVSGSGDKTVRLWDAATGKQKKRLIGHTEWVGDVAFSPDGTTIASGSGDKTIRLWDAATGKHKQTLTGHTDRVSSIAFSPGGNTIASGSEDKTIRLWNAVTGEHKHMLTGHSWWVMDVAFSPDGTTIASGSWDNTIRLWDAATGEHKHTLIGHTSVVWDVAFSPDGTTLANASDGTVLLWDLTLYLDITPTDSQQPQRDSDMVRLVYFRPSDRTAQQGIDAHLTTLIKDVQRFYAAQMHGYGGKTFTLETDTDGNPVVHHLDGNFTEVYYQQGTYDKVQQEIEAAFDTDKHIYLVTVDVSTENLNYGSQSEACGIGGGGWQSEHDSEVWKRGDGGLVVIPASGNCFNVGITAHELGHTFGLEHDFRDETYLMSYGSQTRLSADAAEWLSVHRYFNTGHTGSDQDTTLTVISLRASELKFQLTDADGLHQVQLLIPTTAIDPASGLKLHSSKGLNGETDNTVTFAVSEITGNSKVTLQVIDMQGHITKQTFLTETDNVVQEPDIDRNVARVSLSPASVLPGNVGEQLTVNANITGGADVRGYQVELTFDSTALRFISSTDAGYLPMGAFVVPPVLNGNRVTLSTISLQQSSEGDGTLASFTFEVLTASPTMPTLSDVKLTDSNAESLDVQIETGEIDDSPQLAGDVNGDGVVSLDDMRIAVTRLGETGENTADMNGDGVVDAADLLLIIDAIEAAAGPALSAAVLGDMFTATEVRQWLSFAQTNGLTDGRYQRGFLLLEQFLLMLTPKETLLLANYPNPFNPETWIPYQLAKSAEVSVSIYATDGKLIRTLTLGRQAEGIYHNRSRAAYWDGKNAIGESVASGVYLYTLTAGDFTDTRKMLILK